MYDFTKLWNPTYLWGRVGLSPDRSDWIFLWIAITFVVISAVAKILAVRSSFGSPQKTLWSRFFHLFLTIGLFVIVWFGFRFESSPWLSIRLLPLLTFLWGLVWFGFIIKYYFGAYRVAVRAWDEQKTKNKYLAR